MPEDPGPIPEDPGTIPDDALADIAYLARSRNRVEILAVLSRAPHASRDVAAATEASRSTLERILTELEERGWAERTDDGTYAATPAGEFAVAEFLPPVGAMDAIRTLDEAVAWLPADELSIGLHHFADATVHRPEPNSPTAPATYLTERLRDASVFRCLVCLAPPLAFERAMRDGVVDGRLRTEHVVTARELEYISDQPERMRRWREYLEAGADVYCYDGPIPCNLFVLDETVLLGERQPEACSFVESESETVRSWAEETIAAYRRDAERLDPAAFATASALANRRS